MSVIPTEPVWVDDSATLAQLCERWSQQGAIAIDTEFMRSTTFYPQTALLQVGDGLGCYLLDPLAIEDFEPLRQLLLNPAVTKVLHSCSEDLEVFQCFFDLVPQPIFDTQLGAAMAGYGFSLGYARLVEELLGVNIPKSETRSDWLQRPLSLPQLQYAALDVAYLLVIYGLLLKKLRQQGRLEWMESDCAELVAQAQAGVDPAQMYTRIKLAWKLDASQLAVLQELTRWRELEARARDLPRNRVLKERALWDMARYQPTQVRQLAGLEGMNPRRLEADGETLLAIIDECRQLPPEAWPPLLPPPLPLEQGDLLKALKQRVRATAEQMQIAPEVLARKRDYEDLVRSGMDDGHYCLNARLSGWRRPVVGQQLLELAQNSPGRAR